MRKYIILIIISIFVIVGCTKQEDDSILKNDNKSNINEVISSMKIIIDENEYILNLENNETAISFVNTLPQEFNMNELNGNEKYVYLNNDLPTNSYSPKHINAGDVMLFGSNCLVIFYKSFDTVYSYTKIGHIDNLPDLGNNDILVRFQQ